MWNPQHAREKSAMVVALLSWRSFITNLADMTYIFMFNLRNLLVVAIFLHNGEEKYHNETCIFQEICLT